MNQPDVPDWLSVPVDQADWRTAYTDAGDAIGALDTESITAVAEASEIVETWAEVAAYLIVVSDREDVTSMMQDSASKTLSRASSGRLNKSAIDDTLDRAVEEVKSETRQPVDEVLENGTKEIIERRTSDHTNSTVWAWTVAFEGVDVQFTTTVSKDGVEHFDPRNIQDALYEETGYRPDPPTPRNRASKADDEGWADWAAEFIRRHRRTESVTGERTRFVNDLMAYMTHHPAYTSLPDAMARDAMYVDDDAGDVYVPGQTADRIRDEHALNTNECVTELDARDLTADSVSGVSVRKTRTVDGSVRRRRYWVLDLDELDVEVTRVSAGPSDQGDETGLDPDLPDADPDLNHLDPTTAEPAGEADD